MDPTSPQLGGIIDQTALFVHSSILYLRWDQEFRVGKAPGLHPVEMLARIAKFEVVTWKKYLKQHKTSFQGKSEPRYEPYTKNFRGRGSLGKICK